MVDAETGFDSIVGSVAVPVCRAIELAVQANLVPSVRLLALTLSIVDVDACAVPIVLAVQEQLALHVGLVPGVVVFAETAIDIRIDIGSVAVGIQRTVIIAVFIRPSVVLEADAGSGILVRMDTPRYVRTVKVTFQGILVPNKFGQAATLLWV